LSGYAGTTQRYRVRLDLSRDPHEDTAARRPDDHWPRRDGHAFSEWNQNGKSEEGRPADIEVAI
jgi:predicted oxidoreductase